MSMAAGVEAREVVAVAADAVRHAVLPNADVVRVQVGNIVCITIGDDAAESRRRAFNDLAIPLLKQVVVY